MPTREIIYTGYITKVNRKTFDVDLFKYEANDEIKYYSTFKKIMLNEQQQEKCLVEGAIFNLVQYKTEIKIKFLMGKKFSKKEKDKIKKRAVEMKNNLNWE